MLPDKYHSIWADCHIILQLLKICILKSIILRKAIFCQWMFGMKFCVLQLHFAFDEEFYILKCFNYLEKFGNYLQGSASKFKWAFTEKENPHQCKVEHSGYTCRVHNYTGEKKSIMVSQLMGGITMRVYQHLPLNLPFLSQTLLIFSKLCVNSTRRMHSTHL